MFGVNPDEIAEDPARSTTGSLKSCNVPITVKKVDITIVGFIRGSLIAKAMRSSEAPSMRAASITSSDIDVRAEIMMSTLKPAQAQIPMLAIEGKISSDPRNGIWIPSWANGEVEGWYNDAHMMPAMTVGTAYGKNMRLRSTLAALGRVTPRTSARARAKQIMTGTCTAAKTATLARPDRNSASAKTDRYWPKPEGHRQPDAPDAHPMRLDLAVGLPAKAGPGRRSISWDLRHFAKEVLIHLLDPNLTLFE